MSRILAIDPGISSGWAVVTDDWVIVATGVCQPEDLEKTLHPDSFKYEVETVIIERTPIPTNSEMNRRLRDVTALLQTWYPQALYTSPGIWKNSPAYYLPTQGETQHERDACRIGFWLLSTREYAEAS